MTLKDIFEKKKKLKFLFFGGKGGVGKTSCSAATALYAAEQGINTLILSTDPAHSLGDSFQQKLSGDPTPIKGVPNLEAIEFDVQQSMREAEDKLRQSEETSGMMAQAEMLGVTEMFDTTPPGADEALAFSKILDYIDEPSHELIIFDTAPTGHTLRFLSLPDVFDSWIGKLIMLRIRLSGFINTIKRFFGRGDEKDTSLEQLKIFKKRIEAARPELSDPNKTEFIPVLIPAQMAIFETERLLQALYEYEIPVKHVVVNMIAPDSQDCAFCLARKKTQSESLQTIKEYYETDFLVTEVPLFDAEVQGLEMLRKLAKILF